MNPLVPDIRLMPGQWMNGPYIMMSLDQMLDFQSEQIYLSTLPPIPVPPRERSMVGRRKAMRMARRGY